MNFRFYYFVFSFVVLSIHPCWSNNDTGDNAGTSFEQSLVDIFKQDNYPLFLTTLSNAIEQGKWIDIKARVCLNNQYPPVRFDSIFNHAAQPEYSNTAKYQMAHALNRYPYLENPDYSDVEMGDGSENESSDIEIADEDN